MYLYLKFKDFRYLESARYELAESRIANVNTDDSDSLNLTIADIDECIAYFKDKEETHCYELKITKIVHNQGKWELEYKVVNRLDDLNQILRSDIVRFVEASKWESSFNNLPDLLIVNKQQFIDLKSGVEYYNLQVEINKKLGYLNSKSKYDEIIAYFQPLTKRYRSGDYWNNSFAIYSIAKACQFYVKNSYSKRYNEIDFQLVKKYQALAHELFIRAYELNSDNENYFKELTFSYCTETLNQYHETSSEKLVIKNYIITKKYLDILIKSEPNNLLYLNLKANLIYQIKLHPFKIKKYQYLENSNIDDDNEVKACLKTVIRIFESNQNLEFKEVNLKEYNIAVYNLTTYYLEKNDLNSIDYFLAKLVNKEFNLKCSSLFKPNIIKAKQMLENAFRMNTNLNIKTINSINDIPSNLINLSVSNMILQYAKINTNLYLFHILETKRIVDFDTENTILKYLTIAKKITETKFIDRLNYKYRMFEGEAIIYYQQQITELKITCYLLNEKYNTALAIGLRKDNFADPTVLILAFLFVGDKESLTKAKAKLSIVKQKGYFKKYQLLEVLEVYIYSLNNHSQDFWQLNHHYTDNRDEIILGYYRTLNINFITNKKPIIN